MKGAIATVNAGGEIKPQAGGESIVPGLTRPGNRIGYLGSNCYKE
jgi:hypothetical protein